MPRTTTAPVMTSAAQAKARFAKATKVELPDAQPAEPEVQSAWRQVEDALNNFMGKIQKPSWVRELVNVTVGLIAYASTFFCCMQLVDVVVTAAMMYSGVGLISFLACFLGTFAAFIAAFAVGKFAYNVAAAFSVEGVKSRFTSLFNRAPVAA